VKDCQPARWLVLGGINFIVKSGDKTGIIGANDFGKPTLLKLIGGKMPPTTGRMRSVAGFAFSKCGKIKVCDRH